jgi:ADP-ribosyl-[dinitrogen reductase] hydrolase
MAVHGGRMTGTDDGGEVGRAADRVAGTLLGVAVGDALGAGYEFSSPPRGDAAMIGGGLGPWAPGEWTDDTQQTVALAECTATGAVDLDAVAQALLGWWASRPPDVGISTAAVLGSAARAVGAGRAGAHDAAGGPDSPAVSLVRAAADHLAAHPTGGAGNGALMRTAPIALVHLGDDTAIATAARSVATLTHADPLAGDSCVLWCIAIDRAVREGRLDGVRDGLAFVDADRRPGWSAWVDEAETLDPASFRPNGFTVRALQAAYAAIRQTPVPPGVGAPRHLQDALHAAVRIGDDTDTVAAIAGALLGARWGASAVPDDWRALLHGRPVRPGGPGYRADDLIALALRTTGRTAGDTPA